MDQQQSQQRSLSMSRAGVFMSQVYTWMFAGLLVTAVAAYLVSTVPALLMTVVSGGGFIVLAIATIGLVFFLTSRISTLSASAATGFFLLYATLNGAMLAPVLLIYTGASIVSTFVITALMFGAMAVYGITTKKDLTAMGSFMMMGLIGIIIASIVNFFLKSSAMEFVISAVGVVVFAGLTAYDNQKIRQMGEDAPLDDAVAIRRGAILGALSLYLDFINLFLMLLRLFGDRR